jgi:hypothetical protein
LLLFGKDNRKRRKLKIDPTTHIDPLEPVWESIRLDYPVKNYILKEDLPEQLVPQVELIKSTLKPGYDFSKAFYSYVTFHQIHFHLKNYILFQKKKKFGYSVEFLDLFEDIFVDNFIIFYELVNYYLDTEYLQYLNIWLDGFFLTLIKKTVDEDKKSKYNRIQPQLFFAIILFLALPKISSNFEQVPFTSVIKFKEATLDNWESAITLLKDLDFRKPYRRNSLEILREFLFKFMHLNIFFNKSLHRFYFDEPSRIKAMEIIDLLIEKTPELIENIQSIRKNVLPDNPGEI